jgi:hypothetical protein
MSQFKSGVHFPSSICVWFSLYFCNKTCSWLYQNRHILSLYLNNSIYFLIYISYIILMTWFLWLNLFFICRCQLIEIRLLKYELVDARNSNKKKKCFLILKIWLNMYTAIKRKPQAINEFFDCSLMVSTCSLLVLLEY